MTEKLVEKPIPIDKVCRICKQRKLLTEFEIDESKKDRHSKICKDCDVEEADGICCAYHFQEMAVSYTYAQLALTLNVVEALQQNEIEIPSELFDKMYQIIQRSGRDNE
jgi:superfamily II helicase